MDSRDESVHPEFIRKNANYLGEIIDWALEQNGQMLGYLPDSEITQARALQAVKSNEYVANYIPTCMLSENFCLDLVEQNGMVLRYLPQSLRTYAVCDRALENSGKAFRYIPEEVEKEELILKAVRKRGENLVLIFHDERTEQICYEAIKQDPTAIWWVPLSIISHDLCLLALKNSALVLPSVLNKYKPANCSEFLLRAIKTNAQTMFYIPDSFLTEEFFFQAIEQNYKCARYIQDKDSYSLQLKSLIKTARNRLDLDKPIDKDQHNTDYGPIDGNKNHRDVLDRLEFHLSKRNSLSTGFTPG